MIAAGNDLAIVSKLAGHSSVSITADLCTHMLKGIGQRVVDGAAALIPRRVAHSAHTRR
jgi:site-specific recombinase XerD